MIRLLLSSLIANFVQLCIVYYVGGAFLQFVLPRIAGLRRIQTGSRPKGQLRHDALQSLGPLLVKSLIWSIVAWMHHQGIGRLYEVQKTNWEHVMYCFWAALMLDVLHDTWFYFIHRLLHSKLLYKRIHALHHKTKKPTVFTGYSFHTLEAFMVFANEIIICFVMPLDVKFHRIYHLLTTCIHQGGHLGYEISPFLPTLSNAIVTFLPSPVSKYMATYWLNTVQHHDIHHSHVIYHYSLYFTHWDRLFDTLHPSYDKLIAKNANFDD